MVSIITLFFFFWNEIQQHDHNHSFYWCEWKIINVYLQFKSIYSFTCEPTDVIDKHQNINALTSNPWHVKLKFLLKLIFVASKYHEFITQFAFKIFASILQSFSFPPVKETHHRLQLYENQEKPPCWCSSFSAMFKQ